MTSSAVKRCSFADYLASEETSDVKHEYFDGEIFAMAGGTAVHGLIAANCIGEFRSATKARGCRTYTSDVMVLTPRGLGAYPDLSVGCDKPRYEDDKQRVLLNPLLLVEVLSDSTEAYDRGRKFDNYKSIESLREYVLVAQDRPHVDHFARRDDGRWVLTSFEGLETSVELPALDCTIPMAEIYANVEFPTDRPAGEAADGGGPPTDGAPGS